MSDPQVPGAHPARHRSDRMVVVGDVMNDIVVVPGGAIRPDTDTRSTIRPRPGGSAANTAVWLGSLGVPVDFVGAVGAMDAAQHAEALRDRGVSAHLHVDDEMPTGAIVVIVEGERRTMLTERGANTLIRGADVTAALLVGARAMHVTGHGPLHDPVAFGLSELIDRAHEAGVIVSVTVGSAGLLEERGVEGFARDIRGAEVLFATREEARLLTGEPTPAAALAVLRERHETVVITLGRDGCLLASAEHPSMEVPALRAPTVDPTGAGDAFAAGFLERWITGADVASAARAGTLLAARAVGMPGGRPAR